MIIRKISLGISAMVTLYLSPAIAPYTQSYFKFLTVQQHVQCHII